MNAEQVALSLAEEYGLPIFPCRRDKKPYTEHGLKDATRNIEQISAWWRAHPDALIGVPTGAESKLLVVDVDPLGEDWYRENFAQLAPGRIHKTQRGHHLLYNMPPDAPIRNSAGKLAPGVDVRAEGGYIIWWPAHGNETSGDLADIGPAPDWLIQKMTSTSNRAAPPTNGNGCIPEGGRNDAMTRLAGKMRRIGASQDEIENALIALNERCDPPLGAAELERIAASVARYAPANGRQPELAATGEEGCPQPAGTSDDDLALEFTRRHAGDLRYVAAWDRWLIWDGQRWASDERRRVFDLARRLCRSVLTECLPECTEAQARALRQRLGSAQTVYAVVRLASCDAVHAVAVDQLDADPWALNTPAGIVDLRSGEIRPHDPLALCTKITAAAPQGDCPIFRAVLDRALPDAEVRAYVQRLAGYGLTGLCRDHVLPFFYGTGRNGKGTIAHAIRRALGDYGLEIPAETLMESHHDRHPTEIAVLRGARFVIGSEIDSGRRWNESRLKRLTGGDPISARYIGRDLFEFEPTHTLVIIGNAKPGLRVVDEAIRARIHLVHFGVTIPEAERDTALPERLTAEYSGILAWALEGCLTWQEIGLAAPEAVRAATEDYLAGEDAIAQWIGDCCRPAGQITLSAAHRSYRDWCDKNAMPPLGRNTFGDQLAAHGYRRNSHRKQSPTFDGLSLPVAEDIRYGS